MQYKVSYKDGKSEAMEAASYTVARGTAIFRKAGGLAAARLVRLRGRATDAIRLAVVCDSCNGPDAFGSAAASRGTRRPDALEVSLTRSS